MQGKSPSPDGSENPCGFLPEDCSGQQEAAPENQTFFVTSFLPNSIL
jgi:hypothetical protein